jgi:hypothetical protein
MKHNKKWFLSRIGKIVLCDDHEPFDTCMGIFIDSDIAANNLYLMQKSGKPIHFTDPLT